VYYPVVVNRARIRSLLYQGQRLCSYAFHILLMPRFLLYPTASRSFVKICNLNLSFRFCHCRVGFCLGHAPDLRRFEQSSNEVRYPGYEGVRRLCKSSDVHQWESAFLVWWHRPSLCIPCFWIAFC